MAERREPAHSSSRRIVSHEGRNHAKNNSNKEEDYIKPEKNMGNKQRTRIINRKEWLYRKMTFQGRE